MSRELNEFAYEIVYKFMEGVLNKSLKKRSWRCMRISESYSNFLSLGSVHKLCNFEVNWMNQKDKKIFWRDF